MKKENKYKTRSIKNVSKGNTGIMNIVFSNGIYVVQIGRNRVKYAERFDTLSEAIKAKYIVLNKFRRDVPDWNAKLKI